MDKAERDEIRGMYVAKSAFPGSPTDHIIRLLDHIDALELKREGWKWVPVIAVDQQVEAGDKAYEEWKNGHCVMAIYDAMIAAAPEPQS